MKKKQIQWKVPEMIMEKNSNRRLTFRWFSRGAFGWPRRSSPLYIEHWTQGDLTLEENVPMGWNRNARICAYIAIRTKLGNWEALRGAKARHIAQLLPQVTGRAPNGDPSRSQEDLEKTTHHGAWHSRRTFGNSQKNLRKFSEEPSKMFRRSHHVSTSSRIKNVKSLRLLQTLRHSKNHRV